MKVIIGGCGRVGGLLATRLTLDGHDVSVIDQRAESFARLGSGTQVSTYVGKVFDRATLEAAGVERADAYVAVTSGDNSNVVSAIVAKQEYRVPAVLSRIYDPRRAEIYRRLGIPAFSSVAWSVNEVFDLLLHPHMTTDLTFGDGEVRVASGVVPARLAGHRTDELDRPGEAEVIAIVRAGRSFMPTGGTIVLEHDVLHVAVTEAGLTHLERMLHQ